MSVEAKKSARHISPAKRLVSLVSARRKMFAMLAVAGLIALAISAGAYALAGGYYLAALITALIGLVTLSAFRAEQQHRRILGIIRMEQNDGQIQVTLAHA